METKILLLIGIIVITSGCLDQINNGNNNNQELPNRGLVIEDFTVTDQELRPEQQAVVRADFKNYHEEIDVQNIELQPGTRLDVSSEGCSPEPSELEGAGNGIAPTMSCTWTVEAPQEGDADVYQGGVSESLQLRAEYEASMENQEPMKLDFSPATDIESTSIVSQSSSNGEISLSLTADNPIAMNAGTGLEVVADNDGPGRLPEGFSFEFEPERLFDDCESGRTEEGLQNDRVNFVCTLSSSNQGVQNVFVSTDYKYIKSPVIDITIVDR
ncbi:MAG: hypothetical protein R6V35_04180 [Candidatus Nanohaloarchaea archaeon]